MNKHLRLSERNRVITATNTDQSYPDHPDRFDECRQVLCRESVSGRCYWELEWSGDGSVYISVSYKSISRKGWCNECVFGCNDQSWSLYCSLYGYSFTHNNIHTDLPVKSISNRIGVDDDDDDDIDRIEVDDDDDDDISRIGVDDDDDDDDDISRIGVDDDDDDDDISRIGVDDDDDIRRIGVFVDHGAGTLSFYSVSDTMSLIHTVQTTFTQTLYPGIYIEYGSSVKLC